VPARDELIQMLDALPDAEAEGDIASTITELLEIYLPSEESLAALERFLVRHSRPARAAFEFTWAMRAATVRAKLSGQMNEAWWKERQQKAPAEADLHSVETDLANVHPSARIMFLVACVRAALKAWKEAHGAGDIALEEANRAKVQAYASEVLAAPDIAAKHGDGVYFANHALGMLALESGDIDRVKQYLVDASLTPGAWMLSRLPGPDWSLALELVQRGKWKRSAGFWTM